MGIEEKFNTAVKEWKEHSWNMINSSSYGAGVNCDAYRQIVSFGHESLPLIRKLYDEDDRNNFALVMVKARLVDAVAEIIGEDFQTPDRICGNGKAMKEYTKRWLDENMHRYATIR